jgi:RecB family exonuclease
VTAPPRRRRSYTQLSTYRQCPRLFHHKYILREPEEPSVWSVGGTSFHQVAEWYLGEWPVDPDQQPYTTHGAWAKAWAQSVQDVMLSNPLAGKPLDEWRAAARGKENAAWWAKHGPEMVDRFLDWWRTSWLQVFTDEHGPMIERELDVTFGDVPVIAFPDAVVVDEHGQVNILDYKSGKPPKDALQLGVYAAALREAYGLETTWGLFYMTRVGRSLPFDLARYPHARIVDLFDERERAGDYEPTPGDPCSFCPIKSTCPAFER